MKKTISQKARAGMDLGKKNKKGVGFKAVAAKAAKKYGSMAIGKKVAGAMFQKMKKKGLL